MSTTPAPSLKVLAENKTEGITKSTTFRVDPNLIKFEKGFNLRADNDELELHIDRLYAAMKAGAFIPPVDVSVVDGKILMRDGHCRTIAGKRLRKEVPEFTLECRQLRGNESDAVLHMLGTGSGGKPLTPLEQGMGYARLIRFGLKPGEIAAKLGVSRVTVDNGLALAEAPVEVQTMIAQGEVSATTARDALKGGAEGVEALKAAVVEERKNPTKKKSGKKKKVTAKTLKGTAGEKKPKSKKVDAEKTQTAAEWDKELGMSSNSKAEGITKAGYLDICSKDPADSATVEDQPMPMKDDEVLFVTSRLIATATAEFLRGFGGDDENLKAMAIALETSLM